MNIYLSVGDAKAENWIRGIVGERATWTEFDNAELVVVSRLSDAVKANERGLGLIYVAGLRDKDGIARIRQAKSAGIAEGSILSWNSVGDAKASLLLANILNHADELLPTLSPRHGAYRIKVISTRQSGGTFFAWNLWDTLISHGIEASLIGVSSASPLATWIDPPNPRVSFGETVGNGDVWVIDATDAVGLADQIEADATILVTDLDPSKPLPISLDEHSEVWRVINRVPIGLDVPGNQHLVVIDLGADAYKAMQTSTPVTQVDEVVAQVLWDFWLAIRDGNRDVSLGIEAGDDEDEQIDREEDDMSGSSADSVQETPGAGSTIQQDGTSAQQREHPVTGGSESRDASTQPPTGNDTGGSDGGFSLDEGHSGAGFALDTHSPQSENEGGFSLGDEPLPVQKQTQTNAGGGFTDDTSGGGFSLEG